MLNKEKSRKLVPIVSGAFFLVMTISSLAGMFTNNSVEQQQASEQPSLEERIASQKKGFEIVLQREPNNVMALQGLVDIAIQTNNLSEAIPPLQKLIELNPKEQGYVTLLNEIKQRNAVTTPTDSEEKK